MRKSFLEKHHTVSPWHLKYLKCGYCLCLGVAGSTFAKCSVVITSASRQAFVIRDEARSAPADLKLFVV
jgi:hypothetical protein